MKLVQAVLYFHSTYMYLYTYLFYIIQDHGLIQSLRQLFLTGLDISQSHTRSLAWISHSVALGMLREAMLIPVD